MNDRSNDHRSTKLVWCTWCGFASYDDAVCDRCGSPMIERPVPQIVALLLASYGSERFSCRTFACCEHSVANGLVQGLK